jgi:hypothetical protein
MKLRDVSAICVVVGGLICADATAATTKSIPVVAQIQGAAFFRTSVTISNANDSVATPVHMQLAYRSLVDNSFQVTTLDLSPVLGPRRVVVFDDIIQAFKNAGRIRAADASANIFGTLLVTYDAIAEDAREEAAAVARTYSAGPAGGTIGLAYAGRCYCSTGSRFRVLGASRGGVFGNDGSTRANLGIINEGNTQGQGATDVRVQYYNGDTGALLKQFFVSEIVHHNLEANEVYQINNVFNDPSIPATVHTLVVQVEAVTADFYASSYVVQLDNTTQDGSFFFLEEE